MEKTKNRSYLKTILKISLVVILVVAIALVGGYVFFKYSLGIDIIDLKNKFNLLNTPYSESEIVSYPYSNEDATAMLQKLFGENTIYTQQANSYTFDKTEFEAKNMLDTNTFSGKETSAMFYLAYKYFDLDYLQDDKEYLDSLVLKQTAFTSLQKDSQNTSVDISCTFKFVLSNDNSSENTSLISSILGGVPKSIFATSTFTLSFQNSNCFDYTITSKNLKINNLSVENSSKVLSLLSIFSSDEIADNLQSTFNETFCKVLLGGNGEESFVNKINLCDSFDFVEDGNEVKLKLVKVN